MKQKLTASILTIALMLAMSAPVSAAYCRTDCCNADAYAYLCRLLARCGYGTELCELPSIPAAQQDETPQVPAKPEQGETPQVPAETEEQPPAPAAPGQGETQQTPAGTVESGVRAYEREVVRLVNVERAKAGLAALSEDESLSALARRKSQDMHDRGYFDHNSPTYGTPFQMMKSFGFTYRTAGENIAMGYATPQAVVSAWMNSAGHRANILNASYTRIGVGYVASGNYWTQEFIG